MFNKKIYMEKELEIIRKANIKGTSREDDVHKELRNAISEITDGFANPSAISDKKIDMTATIANYGYSVDDYKKMFGSVMRSEADVVKRLAKTLLKDVMDEEKEAENSQADEAKARKLKLAKAKAKANKNKLILLKMKGK